MEVRLLGKMKLYELAKEMDVSSKDLLEQAKEMGINIKSHLSVISDDDAKNLKAKYQRKGVTDVKPKEEKKPKKENSQKKDNPVIIRREVIIEEEGNKEKKQEPKRNDNKNPFVQRNQKKDYNIVYRNKPTKPMTVSELFGLNKDEKKVENKKKEPRKPVGFITVSIGDGMNDIFKELGVDYIIEGGQTMNPSTEDMLTAIDHVNADHIFILPNNKNIILAANQAQSLTEDKDIIVIPTKTVPQGITAIINYMPEADVDTNIDAMNEGIKAVKTGQVTYAVRDTRIDDKEIHEGDIMGIGDAGILAVGQSVEETTKEMLADLVDEDTELISLYYGQDVLAEDAERFSAEIEELYPDVDVDVHSGGQPIYYYVLSVE